MRGFAAQGTVVVRVTAKQEVTGREYFQLEGYTRQNAWIRVTDTARIVAVDPDSGVERLWCDFGGPPGGTGCSQIPIDCIRSAMLAPGPPPRELPEGFGPASVAVNYLPTICTDAGLLQEVFVPGIGLVRRTMQTIGGPREMVLVEAVVGSTIHPERAVPVLRADLIIRNTTSEPLEIITTSPSGQQFDFEIRNEEGDTACR